MRRSTSKPRLATAVAILAQRPGQRRPWPPSDLISETCRALLAGTTRVTLATVMAEHAAHFLADAHDAVDPGATRGRMMVRRT
jgi:hypothetical protein